MICTQIQLPEDQLEALERLAAAEERSLSDLVREGVDSLVRGRRGVSRESPKARSLAAVGRFRSGTKDLSTQHDRHLAQACEA